MSPSEANRLLKDILETEDKIAIDTWWKTPNSYFDGQPPLVIWSTDHDWIRQYLLGVI
jgi:hypothetical protein